jgi:hypothetical protein
VAGDVELTVPDVGQGPLRHLRAWQASQAAPATDLLAVTPSGQLMYYVLENGSLFSVLDSSLVVRSVAVAQDSRVVLVGDSQGRVHSLDDTFTVRETVQVCPVGESVDALEMYDSEASTVIVERLL